MMRWWLLRVAAPLAGAILALCGLWCGMFFLTATFYQHMHISLPVFVIQLINSLLGFLIFILLIIGFAFWVNSRPEVKRRQRGVFEPIIEAMKRIAQGDFQVRLQPEVGPNAITNELALSVNQMAEELHQMEHMRQEFISNVSHELQSPLASIRGFTHVLHDEQLTPEQRLHYLYIIETESMRMARMTENMLKLASLESEHLRIDLKPYRLDRQIRALILACEPQWTSKAITIEVDLAEVLITADEDLLSQVWSNLLHNSIKFTPEGGTIHMTLHEDENKVICRCSDTGIGIDPELQTRIFERFYKADAARERARGGSGLGLAIARKIVELHKGKIEVASQPGTGTCMTVTLPGA